MTRKLPRRSPSCDNSDVAARRWLLAVGLVAAAALSAGACHKKGAAPANGPPGFERRPYTPIPRPPTRTLKPGEPTPLPRLPE